MDSQQKTGLIRGGMESSVIVYNVYNIYIVLAITILLYAFVDFIDSVYG